MEKQIDAIKSAVSGKYSADEVDDFINMEKKLASKPVLHALMEVIKEGPAKGLDSKEAERLCKKITEKKPYDNCGYVSVSFKETSYVLGISLTLVDKDYRTNVDIPSTDYVQDLYDKYNLLKQCASAYWTKFCVENKELLNRIAEYRADVDFSSLHMDADNPTTLYFDSDCKKRIGIGCFYISPNGQIYYKAARDAK